MGMSWKRIRKSLKNKRNQDLFKKAQEEIKQLLKQHENRELKLFYFDESGFSLTPNVPYGWQGKGCEHLLPSSPGGHINALGMITPDNEYKSLLINKGKIDAEMAIYSLNTFFKNKRKNQKYVIILDNAPIHRSDLFQEQVEKWKKRNIEFYFIPPYSPELNKIEILWKFIKTKWLPLDSYSSAEKLFESLTDVMKNVGKKYRINFG